MGRYLIAVIIACLLTSVSVASAVGAEKTPGTLGLFTDFIPEPGAWSEYGIHDKATGKQTVMRISIVGVEGDSYWLEVVNREGGNGKVFKMLVAGDPNQQQNIQRFILKLGNRPALEMDRDLIFMGRRMMSNMFQQQSGFASDSRADLQDVKTGEGMVTVPAGTFAVEQHQIRDATGKVLAEYKFSREVRPFGIVTSDSNTKTMVLEGRGVGARSLITEEPAMMILPSGMAPGMNPPQGGGPGTGSNIRQIPGMGTGYEPKE
jgi:hypothetical protein